jgi:hypothetical protein
VIITFPADSMENKTTILHQMTLFLTVWQI